MKFLIILLYLTVIGLLLSFLPPFQASLPMDLQLFRFICLAANVLILWILHEIKKHGRVRRRRKAVIALLCVLAAGIAVYVHFF